MDAFSKHYGSKKIFIFNILATKQDLGIVVWGFFQRGLKCPTGMTITLLKILQSCTHFSGTIFLLKCKKDTNATFPRREIPTVGSRQNSVNRYIYGMYF